MVRTRRQVPASTSNTTSAGHIIPPYEYPGVYDYVGKGRYLQVAVCKSIAQLYVTRFGTTTLKSLSNIAAGSGSLEFLLWARSIGCAWDDSVFLRACESNRISILEHLVAEESLRPDGVEACEAAASAGHIDTLQFLRKHNFPWDEDVVSAAVESDELETLQFLLENDCPVPTEVCAYACRDGACNVLRWLHAQGCPLTHLTGNLAAKCSDIEILQFLHANNVPWNELTCAHAALSGDLYKLQFLRDHGCPWDCHTIRWARGSGHDDIAQWAIENGCPEPPPLRIPSWMQE